MTNVAVVVLDTLRCDAFERHFDWLPGRRYDRAWSPSHWTVPVHGAMFTGLYPSETGVRATAERLAYDGPVLAERLREAGYTTRAFSANPYVSPYFDYDRGFESFTGNWRLRHLDPDLFDWSRFIEETADEGPTRYLRAVARCVTGDCRTVPSLRHGLRLKLRDLDRFGGPDDDGAAEALSYVEGTDFGTDEFLFVNLMEAHTPYDAPDGYATTDVTHSPGMAGTIGGGDGDVDREAVAQAYDDCVRYLSDVYEDIFAELTASFDYVITLSDHGELLGEHGGWAHGYGLYPELTHVPLTVTGPGADGVERTDRLASLLDVHATVLDLAGLEPTARGRSLVGGGGRDACLTEYHGLTGRHRHTLREAGVDAATLERYDEALRGVALPGGYYGYETLAGFVEDGHTGERDGTEALASLVADLDVTEPVGTDEDLSEDVMGHLEDLGYA